MKRRFDIYFPWLFLTSDFLASVVSLLICHIILAGTGIFNEIDFVGFLPLSIVWVVVSTLRKDNKIGRTDEYEITFKHLFGTVLWFTGLTAILWIPLYTPSIQVIPVLAVGAGMLVLMGIFRVSIQIILKRYRARGNNYRNAVIVGKGGTSPRLADVFRIRKDFGINFLGYFDDQADCNQTRGTISQFFEDANSLDLDLIYVHEHLEPSLVKKVIDFADENYIKVKMIPGGSLQLEKNLSFSRYGDFFVINVNEIPLDNVFNGLAKRAFDLVFASLVTIFILPG